MTNIQKFWLLHPGLYFGLMAFVGVSFAMSDQFLFLFPLLFMIFPFSQIHRFALGILLAISCYLYAMFYSSPMSLLDQELCGTGHFQLESIASKSSNFGRSWVFKGTLKTFQDNEHKIEDISHVPCTVSLQQNQELIRPLAHCDYLISGRLKQTESGAYCLIPNKQLPWMPVAGSWSFAEFRLLAKTVVADYIRRHYHFLPCANFLSGIATGDFDDRILTYEFSRFGLQHIMAISGFHFGIIAGILNFFLGMLFRKSLATYFLMIILSFYFLFLGYSPSIFRAWVMALIPLSGYLIQRKTASLNSLGIALLAIVIYDPYSIKNIGFQFSFASTAAILLLFGSCDHWFKTLFPLRSLSQMVRMDSLNQHGYCFLTFCRQAFALTLAVNLIACPMTLFHFQKFPMMSLVYNVFFPFFVSISIFLLLVGMLFSFLPYFGTAIHWVNDYFTRFVLNLTYNLPPAADRYFRVTLSVEVIFIYLCIFLLLGVFLYSKQRERTDNLQDWTFV